MATVVIMPKQGNTVESCIITGLKKKVGDQVSEGEVLAEVETELAQVNRQIHRWRPSGHFEHHVADEAPVVVPVSEEVHENLAAGHLADVPSDQYEAH